MGRNAKKFKVPPKPSPTPKSKAEQMQELLKSVDGIEVMDGSQYEEEIKAYRESNETINDLLKSQIMPWLNEVTEKLTSMANKISVLENENQTLKTLEKQHLEMVTRFHN